MVLPEAPLAGADMTVLILHQELRNWNGRGIEFSLSSDGKLDFLINVTRDGQLHREEARAYMQAHADELRRYLAFVQGRDPDDAIRHLEFAWSKRDRWVTGEASRGKVRR